MKQIKTFEEACEAINISPEDPRMKLISLDITPSHIKAEMKLEIIQEALNEGWKFIPDGTTRAYWPWFWFYTDEEMAPMNDEKRSQIVDFSEFSEHYAGLGSARSRNAWSYSYSNLGSRLASKNGKTAEYFGRQFTEIWRDYLCIKIK